MEIVQNAWRLASWHLKRRLRFPNQTIAPILWHNPANIDIPKDLLDCCDEKRLKRLFFIKEEIEMFSRLSNYFPEVIAEKDWEVFLRCNRKQRLDHILFLRERELKRKITRTKKANASANRVTESAPLENYSYLYKYNWGQSLLGERERIASSMRMARAHQLKETPTIAVDCRFLPILSPRGANLTAMQLQYISSENRDRRDPWRMFFVNFDKSDEQVDRLLSSHLSFLNAINSCSTIVIPHSYNSLAPLDKIVYLSPDADEELTEISADEVYVIGGIVDRVTERGIDRNASQNAAAMDGVRCAKLPLDSHVKWASGTKFLTLTAVVNMLCDVYETQGDWSYAIQKNVPVRNIRKPEEKNMRGANKHKKIREFKRQLLAIVEHKIGPEKLNISDVSNLYK